MCSTKASAKRALKAVLKAERDYQVFITTDKNLTDGRPREAIHLTTACFKKFCMMAGAEQGGEAVDKTVRSPPT